MKHLLFIAGLWLWCQSPANATSVLPLDLQQLSTRATLIFHGEVIDKQTRTDEISGQPATFTTFKVLELIKGKAGANHTIKQFGGIDRQSNTRVMIHGIPDFKPGKQYVVFLPEPSSLGFCSPLGLQQGSFSVSRHNNEATVSNGRRLDTPQTTHAAALLHKDPAVKPTGKTAVSIPLAVSAEHPTQARLSDFINTVRAYNTH